MMPSFVRPWLLGLACVGAVAATVGLWIRDRRDADRAREEGSIVVRRSKADVWSRPLTEGRCAITVAHFGGSRARLVRAERDGVIHFAVIESVPRGNPMNTLYQGDWLRSKFGTAETYTIGTFGSARAAAAKASQLCPPALRCLPERPGCETHPKLGNPLEQFGLPLPSVSNW